MKYQINLINILLLLSKKLFSKIKSKLSYKTYLKGQFENSFFLSPTTENEIIFFSQILIPKRQLGWITLGLNYLKHVVMNYQMD